MEPLFFFLACIYSQEVRNTILPANNSSQNQISVYRVFLVEQWQQDGCLLHSQESPHLRQTSLMTAVTRVGYSDLVPRQPPESVSWSWRSHKALSIHEVTRMEDLLLQRLQIGLLSFTRIHRLRRKMSWWCLVRLASHLLLLPTLIPAGSVFYGLKMFQTNCKCLYLFLP